MRLAFSTLLGKDPASEGGLWLDVSLLE